MSLPAGWAQRAGRCPRCGHARAEYRVRRGGRWAWFDCATCRLLMTAWNRAVYDDFELEQGRESR